MSSGWEKVIKTRMVSVKIPEAMLEEIDKMADALGVPRSVVIRNAIEMYLRRKADKYIRWTVTRYMKIAPIPLADGRGGGPLIVDGSRKSRRGGWARRQWV